MKSEWEFKIMEMTNLTYSIAFQVSCKRGDEGYILTVTHFFREKRNYYRLETTKRCCGIYNPELKTTIRKAFRRWAKKIF